MKPRRLVSAAVLVAFASVALAQDGGQSASFGLVSPYPGSPTNFTQLVDPSTVDASYLSVGQVPFSVASLSSNAALYSLSGSASDSTYLVDGSNRLKLVADRSGNSSTNVLVLNGVSTSSVTLTSAITAFGTGDFTLSAKISVNSIGSAQGWIGGSPNCVLFFVAGAGTFRTGSGAALNGLSNTALTAKTVYTVQYVRTGGVGTYYLNGVADGTTADTQNYNVGISSIGQDVGNRIFGGLIYYVRAYNVALNASQIAQDAAGVVQANCVLNVDFTAQSKLTTSFSDAFGNTANVNNASDVGARICGARDLVQLTQSKQGTISKSNGRNICTLDGVTQFYACAPFALSQPTTLYLVGAQKTWSSGTYLVDGASANTGALIQTTSTPQINLSAGTSTAANTNLAVNTTGALAAVFNGASSSLRVNFNSATTGNAGAGNMGGVTLGASGSAASFSNLVFSELVVRSVADSTATQSQVLADEIFRWGITP